MEDLEDTHLQGTHLQVMVLHPQAATELLHQVVTVLLMEMDTEMATEMATETVTFYFSQENFPKLHMSK